MESPRKLAGGGLCTIVLNSVGEEASYTASKCGSRAAETPDPRAVPTTSLFLLYRWGFFQSFPLKKRLQDEKTDSEGGKMGPRW